MVQAKTTFAFVNRLNIRQTIISTHTKLYDVERWIPDIRRCIIIRLFFFCIYVANFSITIEHVQKVVKSILHQVQLFSPIFYEKQYLKKTHDAISRLIFFKLHSWESSNNFERLQFIDKYQIPCQVFNYVIAS